jgi:hypothetical protein
VTETAVIRIVDSLSGSPIVSLFGCLVLHVRSPRSHTSVTLSVNCGLVTFCQHQLSAPGEHIEHEGGIPDPWADRHELYFDVSSEARHIVRLGGFQYDLRLLQVGTVADNGHSSPWYEFEVTQYLPNLPADNPFLSK